MSIPRLSFIGLKLLRLVTKNGNFTLKTNNSSKYDLTRYINLKLFSAGLAFFWPLKKTNNVLEENKKETITPLKKADSLFEDGHYEECYHFLTHLKEQMETEDVELNWRICRCLYNMAKEPKYNKETQTNYINEAFEIICNELNKNWNHFAVHKWYALLLDTKSANIGIKERVKQLQNVKIHMDLAVTYNPNDATALFILGEWCYQVTELTWYQRKIAEVFFGSPPESSYEDALEYFLKAETVQPRFYSLNLLRLGTCYMKLKKDDQAKYYLKLAACYPAKSNDDHMANKEAAELLRRLNKIKNNTC